MCIDLDMKGLVILGYINLNQDLLDKPEPVLSSLLSRLTHISRPSRTKNSLFVADGKKLTSVDGGGGAWVISFVISGH